MDHLSFPALPDADPTGRSAALDDVDHAILRELSADGRMSMRALAERVRVSRSNVYARVERLVEDGVITGFTARVDPARAGLGLTAYVLVTIDQNAWRSVSGMLCDVPYVQHVAFVGGDVDLIMLVRAPGTAALRDIVLARIHAVEGVRSTRTWLVFEEQAGPLAPGGTATHDAV
ncbi:AsnC family transcriptional regulator [Sphaerisporangium krabiense]|uniref:DNA-binding Lrp family transcriptional regulator n=1 Tax=Sphaerisporangium krabiense TaxID=763782 RepID=A0A7W9DP29_9ACTN|nr:Lrp/AsnC family transcriptional regulator [Sphaerisporangium krabiense]MBB5626046.1 DNA-binding Lrp family transcriptional regulator [Sphaerisporangium krabiense]GII64851.1 AsnC family transcriptional regulator [Sphaerisporangium krabiense]